MLTDEEIKAWFGPGIEVIVTYPIRTRPYYTARVPEFGFEARGETLDEAYEKISDMMAALIDSFKEGTRPLPDRGDWPNRLRKPPLVNSG